MRRALAALPLLLLLLPLGPLAGAHHVPISASVVELAPVDGEPSWLCVGGFFTTKYVQSGEKCEFWCITDGGCAMFYKDFDYLGDFPFAITFLHAEQGLIRRDSSALGYVCIYYYEMADLHYTFYPEPVAPGNFGHFYGVKDEGQFCSY